MKPDVLRFLDLARIVLLGATVVHAWAAITISGKVVDENDVPVRDALISLLSAGAPATATAIASGVADPAGVFHLEIPEAGEYRVHAEREGYFVFDAPAVALDEQAPLEIHMAHLKELAESVNVRYSPPAIDPAQTSDTKRLVNLDILNVPFPAAQDYRSALPLMPGALADNAGQLHFNGGESSQADYRLNGFEVSNPATGALNARLNVDTVQTVEWDASRFGADKGRGSSGTVEIRTEMGDNRWRFGGTNFIPGVSFQNGLHVDHWSPRVKISGPLRKDRIWFHTAWDAYYTVSTVSGLPAGQNRTRTVEGSDLTRLQWNVTRSHILTASFLGNLEQDRRNGLSFINPVETTLNRRQSLFLGAIKDQWMVGGGLIEFGFAATDTYLRSTPQGNQPYVITPFGARGNYFEDQKTYTGRQEWLVNGFARPLRFYGTHQLQAGSDVDRSDLDQTLDRHEYSVLRDDGSVVRDVQFLGSPRQFRANLEAYGYVLDRWSPTEHLVVEAGLRTQWDQFSGGAPVAPRLSAAWSPKWAGGARFAAGWGVFYDALTLNTIALSQEQTSITTFFEPSGQALGSPVQTQFALLPANLRLPRFALTSFSVERRLPGDIYGKVNLISRQGSRGLTFEETAPAPALNLYVLDNIQRQRYRAAEFILRKTFLSRYQWFASYTRSEARANAVLNYSVVNPLFAPQSPGPLPWDAPNRFLAWGWAPVEKTWFPGWLRPIVGETDFQVLMEYRTGFPFNVTNEAGGLIGSPGSYRFPNYASLNLALERKFPFRGYLWAWRVGLINALDRANPNVVNSDYNSPEFLVYQRGQARAVNVRLRFLGRI
jgi:hypothetical protein